MLSEYEATEMAQNQLGLTYRNANHEYYTLIGESDLTDEQKLAAMQITGMKDDEIKKIQGLIDNGVSVNDYITYSTYYNSLGTASTENKNALLNALSDDGALSKNEKTMLANRIIDGDWIVDFSSKAATDILTQYGKSTYLAYKEVNRESGLSADAYLNYANSKDNIASDYDDTGNYISYSKKTKVVNFLDNLDATDEQKEWMYHNLFGYKPSYSSRYYKMKQVDGVWCYSYNGKWVPGTY